MTPPTDILGPLRVDLRGPEAWRLDKLLKVYAEVMQKVEEGWLIDYLEVGFSKPVGRVAAHARRRRLPPPGKGDSRG